MEVRINVFSLSLPHLYTPLLAAVLLLTSLPLYALDWQFPLRPGDSRQHVYTTLGAPSHESGNESWFASSGIGVKFDRHNRVVSLEFKGNYGRPGWAPSEQSLFHNLSAASRIGDYLNRLGRPDRVYEDIAFEQQRTITTDDLLNGSGDDRPAMPLYREYLWHIDGLALHVEAWIVDYQEDATHYPRGSIRRVIIRQLP